jgi:hypothetical protein
MSSKETVYLKGKKPKPGTLSPKKLQAGRTITTNDSVPSADNVPKPIVPSIYNINPDAITPNTSTASLQKRLEQLQQEMKMLPPSSTVLLQMSKKEEHGLKQEIAAITCLDELSKSKTSSATVQRDAIPSIGNHIVNYLPVSAIKNNVRNRMDSTEMDSIAEKRKQNSAKEKTNHMKILTAWIEENDDSKEEVLCRWVNNATEKMQNMLNRITNPETAPLAHKTLIRYCNKNRGFTEADVPLLFACLETMIVEDGLPCAVTVYHGIKTNQWKPEFFHDNTPVF